MFKLSHYFNVKRDLATGGEGGAPAAPAEAAPTTEAPVAALLGGEPPAAAVENKPEPFLQALPGADDADAWNQLYTKLGRPETSEGYELPLPEGDNGEFAKTTAEWMHKAGLNKQQAQAIATEWNAYQAQQAEAQQQQFNARLETDKAAVKQSWGADYDANLATATQAFNQFAPPEFVEFVNQSGLINSPVIASMFLKIGSAIAEEKIVGNPRDASQGAELSIAQRMYPSMNP